MGGPTSLEAPQVASEQASVGVGLQGVAADVSASDQAAGISPSELSTASLDGAKIVEKPSVSGTGSAADGQDSDPKIPSVAAQNQDALKAAASLASDTPAKEAAKPKAARYFIQPTTGHNWGILHDHNAVDIANACGTPVVAAADGIVISDPGLGDGLGGWNGGYGNFLLIQHANGTKTRYAHLSKEEVSVGERVVQGQEIGKIGNTGHVTGETGCHLHFEVLGGVNPFAKS